MTAHVPPPMERAQAAEIGALQYWTGRPCCRQHHAVRYTSSGACSECVAGYREPYKVGAVRGSAKARTLGLTTKVAFTVHADDAATVGAFVEALNLARAMEHDAQLTAPSKSG